MGSAVMEEDEGAFRWIFFFFFFVWREAESGREIFLFIFGSSSPMHAWTFIRGRWDI